MHIRTEVLRFREALRAWHQASVKRYGASASIAVELRERECTQLAVHLDTQVYWADYPLSEVP
jgi:hypothetical protein